MTGSISADEFNSWMRGHPELEAQDHEGREPIPDLGQGPRPAPRSGGVNDWLRAEVKRQRRRSTVTVNANPRSDR